MDQKTLHTDAPPPYYDDDKPTSHTLAGYPAPTQNDAPSASITPTTPTTPTATALKLKIGKNSVVERNYNIWSPDATVLYTVERHDRIFSSKPELYLRHRSGTEIASIHLRTGGDVEFSMHGAHYEARHNGHAFAVCWTVDRGDQRYEVRHTQTGINAMSTKHLKLVDSRDRVRARFVSHLSRSMHTLGKVELFGEGAGVAEVQLLETGGTEAHWQEWCLALLVGIAEKEKRTDQAVAASA